MAARDAELDERRAELAAAEARAGGLAERLKAAEADARCLIAGGTWGHVGGTWGHVGYAGYVRGVRSTSNLN